MPESNQVKWIGVRPTNPEEALPVKQSDPALLKSTVTQASNIREVYPKRKTGTTQVAASIYANNSVVTVYQVTAGKTLYLTLVVLSVRAEAAGFGDATVTNAANEEIYRFANFNALIGDGKGISMPFVPPLEIPGTWKIRITSSAVTLYVFCTVFGWEE